MFKLFILSALVAVALTAPALDTHESSGKGLLQRPSPINPDVPSAPKPAEKTTKITDPKEIAKYKREVNGKALKAFLPTATPDVAQQRHDVPAPRKLESVKEQREKRDVEETGASLASVPTIYHDHDHALQTQQSTKDKTEEESTGDAAQPVAPPATEHETPAKRDIPVPLVAKHQHDDSSEKHTKTEETKSTSTTEKSNSDVHSTTVRHETTTEHKSAKRDAVHSHDQHDNGKKEPHDQVQVEDLSEHHVYANKEHVEKSNSASTDHVMPIATPLHASAEHPVITKHPIPVAEFFAQHH